MVKTILTEQQEKELKQLLLTHDSPILTQDIMVEFLDQHDLSKIAVMRRDIDKKFKYGISYNEYITNPKFQSKSNKNNIFIRCRCGKKYITIAFGFYKRKYKEPLCDLCYRKKYMYDTEWRSNNSKAQFVAQNKPEIIEKQIKAQKQRWESEKGELLKQQYSLIGKKLWEDPEYRKRNLSNNSPCLQGCYKGITYGSSLELSFLFWAEENNIPVKNYDIPGIPYVYDKPRTYYPDFIINNNTIVEIKGKGLVYYKWLDKIQKKNEALKQWCENNPYNYRIVFDSDIESRLQNKAKKYHHENNKKNNNPIPG